MIAKDELAAMIAVLESQPHLSIKEEKYLAVCKELYKARRCLIVDEEFHVRNSWIGSVQNYIGHLEQLKGCNHNWNALRLVETSGSYQYCTLCGVKRLAE